ncbi:MAG: hypothetical protein AB1717_07430 [Pseudomonadota bacterium]
MKEMTRIILFFALFFSAALFTIYHTKELAEIIFGELLPATFTLTIITGTLSYTLYSYVEGIAKDIATDENNKNNSSYNTVIDSLSDLKKEILVNAFAVVGLFVLERLAHAFSLLFPFSSTAPFNWPWALATSIGVACFILIAYVAIVQFQGFIIANDYRAVISRRKAGADHN